MLAWLFRLAWRRARHVLGPAVTTLSIRGLRLTLDWAAAEHVSVREILIRGEYWPTPAFRPGPGDIVVDVGANAGVYAALAAIRVGPVGRVVAIEPNPVVTERLRHNLDQNGLARRSEVIEAAVGDRIGAGRLFVGENSTIGSVELADGTSSGGIRVAVETLDHIARERGLTTIDLLKIDVEGRELETLAGGIVALERCRRLVLEVSDDRDVGAVLDRCRAARFDEVSSRPAGIDSGATIVFARRRSGSQATVC